MTVYAVREVTKICPFKDEIDRGTLIIACPDDAPELHKLAAEIDKICVEPVSHEDFTWEVLTLLPAGSEVLTVWKTGPWLIGVYEK